MEILCFGMARELLGASTVHIELDTPIAVSLLKERLLEEFPDFHRLEVYALAINEVYASDEQIVSPADQLAIIPPVSGG